MTATEPRAGERLNMLGPCQITNSDGRRCGWTTNPFPGTTPPLWARRAVDVHIRYRHPVEYLQAMIRLRADAERLGSGEV